MNYNMKIENEEKFMNISISDKNNLYAHLHEIGYYGLDVPFESFDKNEFILSNEYTDFIIRKAGRIADAGLKVCQTHLTLYPGHIKPIGNGTYEDFEDYMLPILIKEIELTKLLNCKVSVIHPYFECAKIATQRGNITLLSKLLPVAKEFGVTLAIENIYGYCDAHISTYEDFLFYMDFFKSPFLGVCLDTGHAIMLKQNPVEMFKKLKNYIVALHLHTTVEHKDLHAIPYTLPDCERIDWGDLYNEMINSEYSGTFNLELRPSENLTDSEKRAYYQLAYKTAKKIMQSKF